VRYFLRVEYDGTNFGGWQNQPSVISVQEVLEKALSVALRNQVQVTGAGRTDAGVHATAQAVHFDFEGPIDLKKVQLSLNALLPRDVAVYNMAQVDAAFHARFSANARQYKYYFCLRKKPLLSKRVWMVYTRVDWDLVRKNSTDLLGKHDFTTFRASGAGSDNAVCTVKKVSFDEVGECFVFTIEADRFIYKMVRSIVGTLVDIGRGRLSSTMAEIIASRNRSRAGSTAPPFGLVLDQVTYPKELIDETIFE
jgi:tRNA pseudouridine38-40 synthase